MAADSATHLWQSALQHLARLLLFAASEPPDLCLLQHPSEKALVQLTASLSALRLGHASLVGLVNYQQVPRHVLEACLELGRQPPPHAAAAFRQDVCLAGLLSALAGALPAAAAAAAVHGSSSSSSAAVTASAESLAGAVLDSLQQQVQPLVVDEVLAGMFERFTRVCATLTVQQPPGEEWHGQFNCGDSSIGTGSLSGLGFTQSPDLPAAAAHLQQLAQLSWQLDGLLATGDKASQPGSISMQMCAPGATLAAAEQALRCAWAHREQQQQPPPTDTAGEASAAAEDLCVTACRLAADMLHCTRAGAGDDDGSGICSSGQLCSHRPREDEECELRLLTALLLTTAVSLGVQQEPCSTGDCADSTRTACSVASFCQASGAAPDSTGLRLPLVLLAGAADIQHKLQQRWRPDWLTKLSDLTGTSCSAIVWSARVLQGHMSAPERQQLMVSLVHTNLSSNQPQEGPMGQPSLSPLWHRVRKHLPALLLAWAASQPPGSADFADVCCLAFAAAGIAVAQDAQVRFMLATAALTLPGGRSEAGALTLVAQLQPLVAAYQQPLDVIAEVDVWEDAAVKLLLQPVIAHLAGQLLAQLSESGGAPSSSSSRAQACTPSAPVGLPEPATSHSVLQALCEFLHLATALHITPSGLVATAGQQHSKHPQHEQTLAGLLLDPQHQYAVLLCRALQAVVQGAASTGLRTAATCEALFWENWDQNSSRWPGVLLWAAMAAGPGSAEHTELLGVLAAVAHACCQQQQQQGEGEFVGSDDAGGGLSVRRHLQLSMWVAGAAVHLMQATAGPALMSADDGSSSSSSSSSGSLRRSSSSIGSLSSSLSSSFSTAKDGSSGGDGSSSLRLACMLNSGDVLPGLQSCLEVFGRCGLAWCGLLPAMAVQATQQEEVTAAVSALQDIQHTAHAVLSCCHAEATWRQGPASAPTQAAALTAIGSKLELQGQLAALQLSAQQAAGAMAALLHDPNQTMAAGGGGVQLYVDDVCDRLRDLGLLLLTERSDDKEALRG